MASKTTTTAQSGEPHLRLTKETLMSAVRVGLVADADACDELWTFLLGKCEPLSPRTPKRAPLAVTPTAGTAATSATTTAASSSSAKPKAAHSAVPKMLGQMNKAVSMSAVPKRGTAASEEPAKLHMGRGEGGFVAPKLEEKKAIEEASDAEKAAKAERAKTLSDADLERIFAEIDRDGGGEITLPELKSYLRTKVKLIDEWSTVARIMSDLDEDGDGRVTLAEFKAHFGKAAWLLYDAIEASAAKTSVDGEKVEQLRKIFLIYDKDQSGELDIDEFFVLLSKLDPDVNRRQAASTMSFLDGDGNGTLSFDELLPTFLNWSKRRKLLDALLKEELAPTAKQGKKLKMKLDKTGSKNVLEL